MKSPTARAHATRWLYPRKPLDFANLRTASPSLKLGAVFAATLLAPLLCLADQSTSEGTQSVPDAEPTATALTLRDVVALALRTNPAVAEARAAQTTVAEELAQARGLYRPQVDAQATVGESWRDNDAVRNDGRWDDSYRVGLVASQLLYDGGSTRAEVVRQASRADSDALRTLDRSEAIALDTTKACLDLLRIAEVLPIAEENLRRYREIVDHLAEKLAGGAATTADVDQAEERLQLAIGNRLDIQDAGVAARFDYLRLVGAEPGPLLLPPSPTAPHIPETVDATLARARAKNPTLRTSEADIDVAYAEWRAARARFSPRVTLEASLNQSSRFNGSTAEERDATVAVVFRYNIFRGNIDTHARREAVARIGETRQRAKQQERQIEALVRRAWLDLDTSERRIVILEKQLAAIRSVSDSYRSQYEVGRRSLLDVLNAENAQFNAQVNLVGARFTALYARHRIVALTGGLLSYLEVSAPPESAAGDRATRRVPATPPADQDPYQFPNYEPAIRP